VTLGVVLKLGRMLEKNKDYKVIYTRKIDEYPSLTYRTDLANRSKADLFISVHVNSSPSKSATAQEQKHLCKALIKTKLIWMLQKRKMT
jgi:N-acetylmuramoyl-L-alanine amidase